MAMKLSRDDLAFVPYGENGAVAATFDVSVRVTGYEDRYRTHSVTVDGVRIGFVGQAQLPNGSGALVWEFFVDHDKLSPDSTQTIGFWSSAPLGEVVRKAVGLYLAGELIHK